MGDRSSDIGARVYVGGLEEGIKKEDLEDEFQKFGKLNNVWIALNPPGFAFVEFCNSSDAEAACDSLNGIDFLGSKLRVEIAKGRSRGGGRGGGGGGGFRGGRGRGGGGGFRGGRDDGGYQERSFRGGPGGGRFDRGGRGRGSGGGGFRGGRPDNDRFGGRDFSRRSDSYGGGNDGGPPRKFGRGRGGGGGGGPNYRSRSPMGGPRY